MASMRDIKRRKISIQSTGQITKAMKLVSTAKLQKAKGMAEETRPYFKKMHATISSILKTSQRIKHPFLTQRDTHKSAYIVITSNRGLAGGYNGNICKLVFNEASSQETSIIAIGRKGADLFRKRGYNLLADYHAVMEGPAYEDASTIGEYILDLYKQGQIDEVYLVYTAFHSTISQEPKKLKLLPLDSKAFDDEVDDTPMSYEPNPEEVLDEIIPKYIHSLLYGALKESVASEHGARMTAMDAATNNANDMIEDLALLYNRARQASITQELSEIVGGAEALK